MELVRTQEFEKALKSIPLSIQKLCESQLILLAHDHHDSRLHSKLLKGTEGIRSFRVTRNYRGLFYINRSSQIIVFTIEHRKDVYR